MIYERDPKSHARYITFAVLTHKGQPQNRELHALLFSNTVWAIFKGLLKNHNQSQIIEPITSTLPFSANDKPINEFMESFTHFHKQISEEQK